MSFFNKQLWKDSITVSGIAIGYCVIAHLTRSIPTVNTNFSPIWPAAGFNLSALLLLGSKFCPGIILGDFLYELSIHKPWAYAGESAVSVTLEALFGVLLLRNISRRPALTRLRDTLRFIALGGLLSTLLGAFFGSALLCLNAIEPWQAFGKVLWIWWLGDSTGVLIVAPILLLWGSWLRHSQPWTGDRLKLSVSANPLQTIELVLWLMVLIVVSWVDFTGTYGIGIIAYPIEYLPFVFVLWSALRFWQGATVSGNFLVSAIAVWGTVNGKGPFGILPPDLNDQTVLPLQAFLGITTLITLVVSTAVAERKQLQIDDDNCRLRLEHARQMLEHQVAERTTALLVKQQELETEIDERKQLAAALKAIEERFHTSVETILDCFAIYSTIRDSVGEITDFRFDYVNAAACESNRMTRAEQIGKGLAELLPAHRNSGLFADYCRVVETGASLIKESFFYQDTFHGECLARALDIRAVKLNDGFVCVWREVTERKRKEDRSQTLIRQLQQENEQLEAVSQMKSNFLSHASHELRTPLTSVLGLSSVLLLQHFGALNNKQAQYVSVIHRSGNHLLTLIDDLLDLAKIEADKLELDKAPTDMTELCQQAIEMVTVREIAKQQALILELPMAADSITVDRTRVLQILLNYLSNAVKFTPEHGTITLSSRLASGLELEAHTLVETTEPPACALPTVSFLVFDVRDTGIGIPLEKQHLLFQVFQQVNVTSDRQYKGTGLGLALTQQLAELHGGRVSFISAPGAGSTFSVWLPYDDA